MQNASEMLSGLMVTFGCIIASGITVRVIVGRLFR
jgi:hypothetical protein